MSISLKGRESNSKYLKSTDLKSGLEHALTLTIQDIKDADLSKEQDGSEVKPALFFVEPGQKPMVLNSTNIQIITMTLGTEPEQYLGKPIRVWNDPNVSMGGKLVGGLRLAKAESHI